MAQTENIVTYETVSPEEFAKRIKSDEVYLLDVRTTDEFKEGHIAGAHNLDVMNPDFVKNAEEKLPHDKSIAVYCGTGHRSGMAADSLSEAGFKILNLDGGLDAWKAAQLPVTQ